LWWFGTRTATSAQPSRLARFMACVPWMPRLLRAGRLATFTEVLALLVEQEVPVPEGVVLAADASGDPGLRRHAKELADRLEQGQTSWGGTGPRGGIPPLLAWLIATPHRQDELNAALRHTANSYRRRASYLGDWLRLYLPVSLTIGIGGTATAVYAFFVLAPWFTFMHGLSQWY